LLQGLGSLGIWGLSNTQKIHQENAEQQQMVLVEAPSSLLNGPPSSVKEVF